MSTGEVIPEEEKRKEKKAKLSDQVEGKAHGLHK